MRVTSALMIAAMAAPAWAEELRPAPDYYVEAVFAIQMAEALALDCDAVTVDLFATQARVTEMTEALVADGFDADQPFAQMIDPAPRLRDMQAAFVGQYGLEDPDQDALCAAARSEMEKTSPLGALLKDDVE